MEQGALGAAGVMRVWAGAGLQRAAYRAGAYCAASRTACYINCERREGVEGEGMGGGNDPSPERSRANNGSWVKLVNKSGWDTWVTGQYP